VARVATHFHARLQALAAKHPGVVVRGAGLMAGLDLQRDASPIVNAALERGLLINRTANTVVRLLPPYVITEPHVDQAVHILEEILN